LLRLREGSRDDELAVASQMADYVGALREHMAIEERELFPRARQLLDDHDLAAIDRAFRRVTDPIFEASGRECLRRLPPVVRYLVEQPAVERAMSVVDTFYESAWTLGDILLGGTKAKAPAVRQAGPGAAREACGADPLIRAPRTRCRRTGLWSASWRSGATGGA
jgi:hypothetical protein